MKMRFSNRIIFVVFLCLSIVILCAGMSVQLKSAPLSLPYLYELNSQAVVQLSWEAESGQEYVATGFIINSREGTILTNSHCVKNGVPKVTYLKTTVPVILVAVDPENDLALLGITNEFINFIPELDLEPMFIIGEEISVIGNIGNYGRSIVHGIVSNFLPHLPNAWASFSSGVYLGDYMGGGGQSGSPVFNTRGKVIGINVGYAYKFGVFVSAEVIKDFLEQNGFSD